MKFGVMYSRYPKPQSITSRFINILPYSLQGYMRYVTEDVCTGDHEHIKEARYTVF